MEERINVRKFVEGYEKSKAKETYLKKIKIVDYVPYSTKVVLAKKIVESSCYDEEKNVRIDSEARYILFVFTLLKSYTNLDMSAESMLEDYDLLNKNGLIDEIVQRIPKNEFDEFSRIVSMSYDDFMTNHYEIHGFIEGLVQKALDVFKSLSPDILEEMKRFTEKSGEEND